MKCEKPSRLIGPEDVKPGQFITISHETVEFVLRPCPIDEKDGGLRKESVEMIYEGAGWPFKVVTVSLPFAIVRDAHRCHYTLDLRRYRIAKLPKKFGKKAFRSIKPRKKTDDT